MKREHRDLLFAVCVLAVIGWAVFEARQWDLRARLFPWAIGIPLIGLLLLQIGLQVRAIRTGRVTAAHHDPGVSVAVAHDDPAVAAVHEYQELAAAHEGPGVPADVAHRRALSMVGWLVAFAVIIWALGFGIGGTLATLMYLKLAAREKWPLSAAITAGTGLFFFVLIRFLNIPFPIGTLLAPFVD